MLVYQRVNHLFRLGHVFLVLEMTCSGFKFENTVCSQVTGCALDRKIGYYGYYGEIRIAIPQKHPKSNIPYIYIYNIYIYTHIYIYTIYIYIHIHNVYIYIYIYTHTMYMYIYTYTHTQCIYIYIHIHTMYIYIYTYTHTQCIYIYTCMYIYIYTIYMPYIPYIPWPAGLGSPLVALQEELVLRPSGRGLRPLGEGGPCGADL